MADKKGIANHYKPSSDSLVEEGPVDDHLLFKSKLVESVMGGDEKGEIELQRLISGDTIAGLSDLSAVRKVSCRLLIRIALELINDFERSV
jgi:hypothetical protein